MPVTRRHAATGTHAHSTGTHHRSRFSRMLRGGGGRNRAVRSDAALKGAVNNPNNTAAGRKHAQRELNARGELAPKVRMSTRIRHWLHLGGRTHTRRY